MFVCVCLHVSALSIRTGVISSDIIKLLLATTSIFHLSEKDILLLQVFRQQHVLNTLL